MQNVFRRGFEIFLHLLLASGLFWAAGCSLQPPRSITQDELQTTGNLKKIIEAQKRPPAPGPPPFQEKLEPPPEPPAIDSRLYSLNFENAPLGTVIRAVIQDSGYDFILASDIDPAKPVTVRLTDATLREALDLVVVRGAGYAWEMDGGVIHIQRFEERIYALEYLDLLNETDIEIGGDMLGSSTEESGVSGKILVKARREAQNADLWNSIRQTLMELKSGEGVIQINRNTGIVYMLDTPKKVAAMVRFLDSVADALTRQVFIEAKILEVRLSEDHQYGIDWSNLDAFLKTKGDFLPDLINANLNDGGTLVLSKHLVQTQFNLILDFLETQGDVSSLSNPHVSVTNGQTAVMTVGYQFPYGDVDGVDRDLETGVVTIGTTIRRAVLGLQLGITPHISKDRIVTLHIAPTITRIQRHEDVELATSATTAQTISNPVIDLQELATTVRVAEGRSVMLAGLISQIRRLDQQKVPIFHHLPFFKTLFQHTEELRENQELVIFITPYFRDA